MGFLVAAACGLVGNYLILRRMALVGDAISHSVLPGLVIGFLLANSRNSTVMFAGALAAGIVTTLLIEMIHKSSRVKQDAAIGITFSTLFAIGVIASRSPIYSVLSLVAAMCMMAGLFVLLKATLVATILVLVYAGAILVLFLFVVMLIDFKTVLPGLKGLKLSPVLALTAAGLLFWQIMLVIRSIRLPETPAVHGSTQAIGRELFSRYVLPFELTAFLLLAAVVSVVVLAKKDVQ